MDSTAVVSLDHLGLNASIELSPNDGVPVVTVECDPSIELHLGDRAGNRGPLIRVNLNDGKIHGLGPLGDDAPSARVEMQEIFGRAFGAGLTIGEDGSLEVDDARDVEAFGVKVTVCTSSIDALPVVYVDTVGGVDADDDGEFPENEHGPVIRVNLTYYRDGQPVDTQLFDNGWGPDDDVPFD